MKKIRTRDHAMVDQIKMLIVKSFPPALGIVVDYFEGEDEATDRLYLAFSLTSTTFGDLYLKSRRLGGKETYFDIEADFVGVILADFLVYGTSLLLNSAMARKVTDRENSDNILKDPFSKGRFKNLNLN